MVHVCSSDNNNELQLQQRVYAGAQVYQLSIHSISTLPTHTRTHTHYHAIVNIDAHQLIIRIYEK